MLYTELQQRRKHINPTWNSKESYLPFLGEVLARIFHEYLRKHCGIMGLAWNTDPWAFRFLHSLWFYTGAHTSPQSGDHAGLPPVILYLNLWSCTWNLHSDIPQSNPSSFEILHLDANHICFLEPWQKSVAVRACVTGSVDSWSLATWNVRYEFTLNLHSDCWNPFGNE